jgi:hypothetical protein
VAQYLMSAWEGRGVWPQAAKGVGEVCLANCGEANQRWRETTGGEGVLPRNPNPGTHLRRMRRRKHHLMTLRCAAPVRHAVADDHRPGTRGKLAWSLSIWLGRCLAP